MCAGNNVSIKVEVDPRHPKMLPECCLLGAEHGGYDLGVKVCLQAAQELICSIITPKLTDNDTAWEIQSYQVTCM